RRQHPGKGRRLRPRGGESRSVKVGVVGAAGYAGGELLRLLLGHPKVDEIVAGSESLAGKPIISAHPNLRKRTSLTFVHYEDVSRCDVLFLALPNGAHRAHEFEDRATVLIDLSSDHRLRDPADYDRWYGSPHPRPALLDRWTYGIPELHRNEIRSATRITGAGCNATASILALLPLFRAGVVDHSRPVVIECKVGSSEGGREPSEDSHHPERSGVVRSFRPVGHRHTAEIEQELALGGDPPRVDLSVTSVELVRGVLATAHVYTKDALGHAQETITSPSGHSSRRTDRRTLEIFAMAALGVENFLYVEKLQQRGIDAIGLSGLSGRLLVARKKDVRAVRGEKTVLLRDD